MLAAHHRGDVVPQDDLAARGVLGGDDVDGLVGVHVAEAVFGQLVGDEIARSSLCVFWRLLHLRNLAKWPQAFPAFQRHHVEIGPLVIKALQPLHGGLRHLYRRCCLNRHATPSRRALQDIPPTSKCHLGVAPASERHLGGMSARFTFEWCPVGSVHPRYHNAQTESV